MPPALWPYPVRASTRVVLASNNAKKLAELQALLAPAGVELVAQGALGVDEAEEPFGTFVENALAKARHAAAATGLPAIADDSGLCVDALGGAPGVHSARYATLPGVGTGHADAAAGAAAAGPTSPAGSDREARRRDQDAANNARLLEALAGRTDRGARFVATLVAIRAADDPEPLIAVGRWFGRIAEAPSGQGGFGYDPLMTIEALGGLSVAALTPEVKNAHSHRALAARQMLTSLRDAWSLR